MTGSPPFVQLLPAAEMPPGVEKYVSPPRWQALAPSTLAQCLWTKTLVMWLNNVDSTHPPGSSYKRSPVSVVRLQSALAVAECAAKQLANSAKHRLQANSKRCPPAQSASVTRSMGLKSSFASSVFNYCLGTAMVPATRASQSLFFSRIQENCALSHGIIQIAFQARSSLLSASAIALSLGIKHVSSRRVQGGFTPRSLGSN